MVKRIIIGSEECLAFLFDMFFSAYRDKDFCSYARVDNRKIEKELDEIVKQFKKEYQELKEKYPTLPEMI